MFLYNNLPKSFINYVLKHNYTEICSIIDRTLQIQPLIRKYKYIENVNNLFINILNNYDFSKIKIILL